MMWKKYNGRIAAVCVLILMLCMTIFPADSGTEHEEILKEQQLDTAMKREQETPAPVAVETNDAETEQAAVGVEDVSETGTSDVSEPEHDFAPVSYDLTNLPPMENEMYAEWEGNIYYRQYSDEDMEDGGLWAYFGSVPGTEKEIMCMKPDGSVTQVGVDYGCNEFYIVNGRIYSSAYGWTDDEGREVIRDGVYSCALDGSDVREYDSSWIYDVRGNKIVCAMGDNALAWIDGRDGEEHILLPKNDAYHGSVYLGATEEAVFLSKLVRNESEEYEEYLQPYDVTLYFVDYQGNTKDLATVTMQEYTEDCVSEEFLVNVNQSPLFISYFQIMENDLFFSVGTTNGTAHVYSGGMIYRVKKDGSGLTRLVKESLTESFYLYDNGANRVLFCRMPDQRTGEWQDEMQQVILQGKAVDDIVVRDADQTYFDQPHSYVTADGADEILFYPDTSGVCYVLLTSEESEALGIRTHVDWDMVQQIGDIEYLNGKLFFTVTDLTYSEAYSIGWRDGYERGRSVCYCKDLESGEIRALYEY